MNEERKCDIYVQYYLALEIKKILTFGTICMNLENIMLSEISQPRKDKCCMIPLTCRVYNSCTHWNRVEWWLPGARGGEK